MEQLEHEEEAARVDRYRLAAEAVRRQQAELRERKRLEAEAAELLAELDASKRAQRDLAAEVVQLRQVVDGAPSTSQRDDQLEAATAALQSKEARYRQELEAARKRADDAEQQAHHFRRASEAQKEALKQAHAEHAAALEHARAADLRALKQAQLQLARAAAEAENLLTTARDDADARAKQLERELAHARGEAERHRDERSVETAALQAQLRAALDGARAAEERNASLEEQCNGLRTQLAVLRDVASDAQLEANRASSDARALDGSRMREAASRARESQLSTALRQLRAEHGGVVERLRHELLAQAEAHQVTLATVKMRTADLRDENRRRTREVKELRREVCARARRSRPSPCAERAHARARASANHQAAIPTQLIQN
jgi:hypothetical protein